MVPAELRERAGLHAGQTLVLIETPKGLLLLTREQLRQAVRDNLKGKGLVENLLAERGAALAAEAVDR